MSGGSDSRVCLKEWLEAVPSSLPQTEIPPLEATHLGQKSCVRKQTQLKLASVYGAPPSALPPLGEEENL